MEMLKRFDDSRLMFYEQFEISKIIKNSKFKANALLNLVNLYLNKTKIDSTLSILELASKQVTPNTGLRTQDHIELVQMLRQLFDIYQVTFLSSFLAKLSLKSNIKISLISNHLSLM